MPQTAKSLNRVLLLAMNPHAQAVMQQTEQLSRSWLPMTPPLYALTITPPPSPATVTDGPDALLVSLTQACDALADQAQLDELRRHGWSLTHANELHVWCLIDAVTLAPDQAPNTDPVANLPALVQMLTELAWQRLRVHVAPHLLLLVEPAQQQQIQAWAHNLRPVGIEHIYVASPVSYEHTRLTPAAWQRQTALVLTTLIWNTYPSHTLLERSLAQDSAISAIGGAAWLSPRPALKQWLALQTAQAFVQGLQQSFQTNPCSAQVQTQAVSPLPMQGPLPILGALQNVEQAAQALAATVTPPPNGELWRGRRPHWPQLANLAATLAAAATRRAERYLVPQRQARQRWLGATLAAWATAHQQMIELHSAPAQGWPALAHYQRALHQLRQEVQAKSELIADQLANASERLAQAAHAQQQAQQALQALCRALPAYTIQGVLSLLLQPWRWFTWGWMYAIHLPPCGQRFLDTLAAHQQAAWHEANWHVLRQVYLAVAQDVRQQLNWVAALEQQLAALAQHLADQITACEQQLPSPWHHVRLQQLWASQFGASPTQSGRLYADLAPFLAQTPLLTWEHMPLDGLIRQLIAWCTARWAELDDWSVLDGLTMAFATEAHGQAIQVASVETQTASSQPSLFAWLDDFLQQAAPLWPNEETATELQERWLLLPPANQTGQSPIATATSLRTSGEMIQTWAETQPDLLQGVSPLDALIIVRWVALDALADEL